MKCYMRSVRLHLAIVGGRYVDACGEGISIALTTAIHYHSLCLPLERWLLFLHFVSTLQFVPMYQITVCGLCFVVFRHASCEMSWNVFRGKLGDGLVNLLTFFFLFRASFHQVTLFPLWLVRAQA